MVFQERFHAVFMAANSTYTLPAGALSLGFFLCNTAGTITVTASNGVVKLNAFPVSAGVYYPIPVLVGYNATIVLAGGASGTLGTGT